MQKFFTKYMNTKFSQIKKENSPRLAEKFLALKVPLILQNS